MPGLSRLPSLIAYLARRRHRRRLDLQAAEELCWDGLEWPEGLEMEWLGTSGFALRYQGTAILIDPYLTRVPLGDVLWRRRVGPDPEVLARRRLAADAVLVGHAHFDHVMDVPAIARDSGATVYGSRSTARLMALHDLADRAVIAEPGRTYEVGPFAIEFVPSVHSRLVLGLAVPYDGDISCEHLDELTPARYRCGEVYGIRVEVAGVSLYHQGSADVLEEALGRRPVDVFLAGIAGRGFTRRYLDRILPLLSPRVVVPHHFDDFFRPLEAPMEMSFNVNLAGFVDEVAAVSKEIEVAIPRRVA